MTFLRLLDPAPRTPLLAGAGRAVLVLFQLPEHEHFALRCLRAKIVQDVAVAATLNGDPTDIAYRTGLLAVIDGSGTLSHLSIFHVDGDGNLTRKGVATINSAANGVAIVRADD